MPVFEYSAIGAQGKEAKGMVDAENLRAARQKLRSQGIFPTAIRESNDAVKNKSQDIKRYFKRDSIAIGDLAVATRQLATLVGAGLPLVGALSALSDQVDSSALKRIIVNVRERVEQGESLAKSIAAYPKAFPRLYINMVTSGEASGTLDSVLSNLADYLESQVELRRKVTSALLYPIIMLCICTLVISGLLIFLVPRIVEIFSKQKIALPLPTQITIFISNFLSSYWYLIILMGIGVAFYVRSFYATDRGRKTIDGIMLKLPIYGGIYTKVATARVSRTLGTLLSSGVELLAALDIAKNIVNNVHVTKALEDARDGVREGRGLAKELTKSGIFPSMLGHMIAVGEKSGELESMLGQAGKAYEREVNSVLSGLTALIEPLMLVGVGMIVLCIVISVLLPMTQLISAVQG